MKVSYPYMNNSIFYEKLLTLLGHEVISPLKPTQKTVDIGVKYSPEFACFPFKVILGSYIESIQRGAQYIITSGGSGPCRAGYYCKIHKMILDELGYDVEFITFDSIYKTKSTFSNFIKNLIKVKNNIGFVDFLKKAELSYRIIKFTDDFEKQISNIKPYEVEKGVCDEIFKDICEQIKGIESRKDLCQIKKDSNLKLEQINLEQVNKKVRIGIIGEIYVVMESFVNMNIENIISSLGCQTVRSQYLSDWINFNILPSALNFTHEKQLLNKAKKYLPKNIGGHAKQNIGHIIDFKEKGFDGIVHIMPFGCLPELVVQSMIPNISKEYDIPIMSISLDEQSSIANYTTRIEAFIDLIKNKKKEE